MIKTLQSPQYEILLSMLRGLRISQRLRQSDLAALLGRGQGTVSKVERGERRIDVIELRAWLKALGADYVAFQRELDRRLDDHPTLDPRLRSGHRRIVPSRAPRDLRPRR